MIYNFYMQDKEHFLKRVAPKLFMSGLIALGPIAFYFFEANAYTNTPFELKTNSLEKTITLETNGDAYFEETMQITTSFSFLDQWIYFKSFNEDVPSWSHRPEFDKNNGFSITLNDLEGELILTGDGQQNITTSNSDNERLMLGFGWLPLTVDEFGDSYPPFDDQDEQSVRFFFYHENGWDTVEVKYSYWIRGLALQYDDTSEMNWSTAYTNDQLTENIDVTVILPETVTTIDDVQAFSNGASLANAAHINQNNQDRIEVHYEVSKLFPNEYLQSIITFPQDALTISPEQQTAYGNRIEGVDHLPLIEADLEEQATNRAIYSLTDIVAWIALAGLVMYAISTSYTIYKKYDQEHASLFYGEYYRELPAEYGPAIMSFLYRFGEIEKDDVSATLMDLIHRDVIAINSDGQSLIDPKANYTLILDRSKVNDSLNKHEMILIAWFFDLVAKGDRLTINMLDEYTKVESRAIDYLNYNQRFNLSVVEEGKKKNFFDDVQAGKQQGIALTGLLMIGGIIFSVLRLLLGLGTFTFIVGGLLIALSTGLGIYFSSMQRRSIAGNEDYLKWRAFKKFLTDFSRLQDYSMPMIQVWEKFMVYAVAFGIAELVEKQLRFKYQQLRQESTFNQSRTLRYPFFYRYYVGGLSRSFMGAQRTIAQAQAARNNSGRGGGGRFGGGGGMRSGGGGGGMRGR
jgi:uncharacterized membrane protein